MNNNFYIPQSAQLKEIIHSIWQVHRCNPFCSEHIIPKGVVEIIFNFSDTSSVNARFSDSLCQLPKCFINGFNTSPVKIGLPEKQQFFGVQLMPSAVKKLFGTPAASFSNIAIDLAMVDKSFDSLWHQLADQQDFDKRVAVFCNWAEKKSLVFHSQEKMLDHFLYSTSQHDLSVPVLAKTLCYSPRHLSRKIFEVSGMNTEEILLYKKYLHAIHLIHNTDLSLTKIAYQSNFSDQSHFIKSFRAYAQLTPGEYKDTKGFVKGHFYKDVR